MNTRWIGLLVSALSLVVLVAMMRDEAPQILATLKAADPAWIAAAVAVTCVSVGLLAKRLCVIYGVQDTRLRYPEAVHITFIGYLFNNFLPTAVGGDLVKAYCGSRITGRKLKSFTAVLLDRIFGLLMYVLIPSITILFLLRGMERTVPVTVFSVFLIALFTVTFLFNRNLARKFGFVTDFLDRFGWGDKLRMLYDGMHHFKNHKRALIQISLWSLGAQLLGIVAVYLFIRAIGAEAGALQVLLLTPVVHLMSMIPSINGLGVRETGFVYFFGNVIGPHNASALAILYLFLLFFLSAVGGAIYLWRHEYHFRLGELKSA